MLRAEIGGEAELRGRRFEGGNEKYGSRRRGKQLTPSGQPQGELVETDDTEVENRQRHVSG